MNGIVAFSFSSLYPTKIVKPLLSFSVSTNIIRCHHGKGLIQKERWRSVWLSLFAVLTFIQRKRYSCRITIRQGLIETYDIYCGCCCCCRCWELVNNTNLLVNLNSWRRNLATEECSKEWSYLNIAAYSLCLRECNKSYANRTCVSVKCIFIFSTSTIYRLHQWCNKTRHGGEKWILNKLFPWGKKQILEHKIPQVVYILKS